VRERVIECVARPVHLGSTTQLWDATVTVTIPVTVTANSSGKLLALFRCTQMLLYPR